MKPKPFPVLLRRIHMYLGLFFMPWMLMYGLSSLVFNHPQLLKALGLAPDVEWVVKGTWPCDLDFPLQGPVPEDAAAKLVAIAGLNVENFGNYRLGNEPVIHVGFPEIWTMKRLRYFQMEGRLVYDSRRKNLQQILTSLHARGGYGKSGLLNDLWAMAVDGVCLSFLLWAVSGLYLWWCFSWMRFWGGVALLTGTVTFAAFLLFL